MRSRTKGVKDRQGSQTNKSVTWEAVAASAQVYVSGKQKGMNVPAARRLLCQLGELRIGIPTAAVLGLCLG